MFSSQRRDSNIDSPIRRKPGPRSAGHTAPANNPTWNRFATHAPNVQAKLEIGAPDDEYEQEADRVSDHVMRMPQPGTTAAGPMIEEQQAPSIQRLCAGCEDELQREPLHEEEKETEEVQALAYEEEQEEPTEGEADEEEDEAGFVQTKPANGGGAVSAVVATHHKVVRTSGEPLSGTARAYFEPRFRRDFSTVRVHRDTAAAQATGALRARAYTTGKHIVFGTSEYAPETEAGRRLLSHELTHVVQQGGGGGLVRAQPARSRISGDWIIDTPNRRARRGGLTDAEHAGQAFHEICGLATRSGSRIAVNAGPPRQSRMSGCACLRDIEADLASPAGVLSATPHVGLRLHGWSSAQPRGNPPRVNPRHPEGEFQWGYWTGRQTRHVKPFWQTVAHEVCGHVATFVRVRGAHAGGRGSGLGHTPAIIEENLLAGEHGVPSTEHRGVDIDPATGRPAPGHRGESFLQAQVMNFAHGSDAVTTTNLTDVVANTTSTVSTVAASIGRDLFVQVEGFAYGNEGGLSLARQRATAVRRAIESGLRRRHISLVINTGTASVLRFFGNLAVVRAGSSMPQTSDPSRAVQVYLFHQAHSAGP
jgi:hypothetical protein